MNYMIIYNHSPICIQNFLTTIKGLSLKRKRYNKEYESALKEFLERDYTNYQQLIDYQWSRTEELINYAYQHSPFYQRFYDGINLKEVIAKRDISLLPWHTMLVLLSAEQRQTVATTSIQYTTIVAVEFPLIHQ